MTVFILGELEVRVAQPPRNPIAIHESRPIDRCRTEEVRCGRLRDEIGCREWARLVNRFARAFHRATRSGLGHAPFTNERKSARFRGEGEDDLRSLIHKDIQICVFERS